MGLFTPVNGKNTQIVSADEIKTAQIMQQETPVAAYDLLSFSSQFTSFTKIGNCFICHPPTKEGKVVDYSELMQFIETMEV